MKHMLLGFPISQYTIQLCTIHRYIMSFVHVMDRLMQKKQPTMHQRPQ